MPVVPTRKGYAGTLLALSVAATGNAIPFGLASGPYSNHVNAAEWTLSACYAVTAVLLWLRLFKLMKGRLATLLSAGCWTASSCYAFFGIPNEAIRERFGIGLIFAGLAIGSLFMHAREVVFYGHLPHIPRVSKMTK